MNKILYEASYVGSSKGFFNIVIVVIGLSLGSLVLIYMSKREKRKYRADTTEEGLGHMFSYIYASMGRFSLEFLLY